MGGFKIPDRPVYTYVEERPRPLLQKASDTVQTSAEEPDSCVSGVLNGEAMPMTRIRGVPRRADGSRGTMIHVLITHRVCQRLGFRDKMMDGEGSGLRMQFRAQAEGGQRSRFIRVASLCVAAHPDRFLQTSNAVLKAQADTFR